MKLTAILAALSLASCAATSSPMSVAGTAPAMASVPSTVTSPFVIPAVEPSTLQTENPGKGAADATDNRVAILIGQRNLDQDLWEPVDEQFTFMLEYAHEAPGSIIGWEVGFGYSADSGNLMGLDVDGQTYEIYGGVVKSFLRDDGPVRPYLGGGLSFINGEFESLGQSDDDNSIAAYVHGGVAWNITPAISLGLDIRFLFESDITLFGQEADADYGQTTIFAGWSF